MKAILSILCAVLTGVPAVAADAVLKCKGTVGEIEVWFDKRGLEQHELGPHSEIEYTLSFSDTGVTFQVDSNYDFGRAPIRSAPILVIKKSDRWETNFESVERSTESKEYGRVYGFLRRREGEAFIFWRVNGERWRVKGRCEFLVSRRGTISPKAT